MLGGLREEHGGLTRGVATSDHDYVLTVAELRLHESCAIVHAGALEARQILDGRPSILGAGRDDDRARRYSRTGVQLDGVRRSVAGEPCGRLRDQQVRTE